MKIRSRNRAAGDRAVVGNAPVSAFPVQLYLDLDETTVLSADQGTADKPGHTVPLIDAAAMTVRGTVDTGSGPHGVVIDTAGTRTWVTNNYDNTVSVINLGSCRWWRQSPSAPGPRGISYSPRLPPVLRPPRGMSPHHPRTPTTTPGQQPSDEHGQ